MVCSVHLIACAATIAAAGAPGAEVVLGGGSSAGPAVSMVTPYAPSGSAAEAGLSHVAGNLPHGAPAAMIPGGRGGAWMSLTGEFGWDGSAFPVANLYSHTNPPLARWNPIENVAGSVPGEEIADDPANPLRRCWSSGTLPSDDDTANSAQMYTYRFQHTSVNPLAQLDERPAELWIEFEMYMDWERVGGLEEGWAYFKLRDGGGRELRLRNQGTSWSGPANGAGAMLDSNSHYFDAPWDTGEWRTVRVHYRKSSDPGPVPDGVLQVFAAVGSHGNPGGLGPFSDQLTVNGEPHHRGDVLSSFSIGAQNAVTYTPGHQCTVQVRNVYWSTTLPAPGMDAPTPWFHTYARGRAHLGAQTSDETNAGKVKQRVWLRYDRNQFAAETSSVDVRFQYRKAGDPGDWSVFSETNPVSVSQADMRESDYCYAETIRGLDPSDRYVIRAVFNVDGGVENWGAAESTFKTMSATGSAPGTVKIAFSSCGVMNHASFTPHPEMDRIAEENANLFFHLGDIEYNDAALGTSLSVANYIALGSPEARRSRIRLLMAKKLTGNSPFEKTSGTTPSVLMWDDHDVKNAWGGAYTGVIDGTETGLGYTTGTGAFLRDESESVYNEYVFSRAFNDAAINHAATVHYQDIQTAKALILVLDTRRFFDRLTTVLGSAQRDWAIAKIQATTKPIVVLTSGGAWRSTNAETADNFGGYTAERDQLLQACQNNPAIRTVVLLSADRHHAVVHKSDFMFYPKVWLEASVSPLGNLVIGTDEERGPDLFRSTFGKTTSQIGRGYGTLTIDERTMVITVKVINGEDGSTLYSNSVGRAIMTTTP